MLYTECYTGYGTKKWEQNDVYSIIVTGYWGEEKKDTEEGGKSILTELRKAIIRQIKATSREKRGYTCKIKYILLG